MRLKQIMRIYDLRLIIYLLTAHGSSSLMHFSNGLLYLSSNVQTL